MSDPRIQEASERLYDRARKDGFDRSEAKARVSRASESVARGIDRGTITPPRKTRG